ncbi:ATP-binding protein [Fundidesulfovibrio agrisoli]|uniref:ATP-binding protein n=1 Tax=Fundidesulfovibrio agrisoli TaxID=2922717 RepID=UPI001FAE49BC|nr:ATP-binding protein [Fundidesulfovibrio agrisoli]
MNFRRHAASRGLTALVLAVALCGPWAQPASAGQDPPADQPAPAKRVLVAFAETPEYLAYPNFLASIKTTLAEQYGLRPDFSIEYLAMGRNARDSDYSTDLKRFLAAKYRYTPPDVVISFGGTGAAFMLANGAEMFPGKPLVVAGATMGRAPENLPPGVTVLATSFDPARAVQSIQRLRPLVRNIAVVIGASPAELRLAEAWKAALGKGTPDCSVEFVDNRRLVETIEFLARLRPNSAILFHSYFQDGAGAAFHPLTVFHRIASEAGVPLFVTQDTFVGVGGVGGYVISNRTAGAAAARVVGEILSGKPQDGVLAADNTENLYDWRQLRRWGIEESRLPKGSRVEYREPSAWLTYRWQIVAVLMLLAFLFSYIVILHVARARHLRMQGELARSKNKLHALLEAMPSAIIAVDQKGLVSSWNREAALLSGVPEARALGLPLREAFPWLAEQVEGTDAQQLASQSQHIERADFLQGEEHRFLSISMYAVEEGEAREVVLRVDDVSRQVRLEELMIHNEKIMSLGGLAAGMAHEINNPLGIILQSVQNVERRLSPVFAKNGQAASECGLPLPALDCYLERRGVAVALKDIKEAGARAAEIVRNTLDFSRKDGEGLEPCDLVSLLGNIVGIAQSDFDLESNYDMKKVRLIFDHGPGPVTAHCSRSQIGQVFLNLIKNGVQAMGTLEAKDYVPTLTMTVREDQDTCYVEFADNGPGIPESVQKHIFEPFFTTKKPGKGTGLGLSVSYFIVARNHGGRMSVESVPGKGARFMVALPKFPRGRQQGAAEA